MENGIPVRVRQDVWSLSANDDTLLWYARAIDDMQQRLFHPFARETSALLRANL